MYWHTYICATSSGYVVVVCYTPIFSVVLHRYAPSDKRLLCWEERCVTTLKTVELRTNDVVDSFNVYLLEILKLF